VHTLRHPKYQLLYLDCASLMAPGGAEAHAGKTMRAAEVIRS
jgi:hypothetical protein